MEPYVEAIAKNKAKKISGQWKVGLQGILDAYLGKCPEEFTYEGKKYTPQSFAASLGLNFDDYVTVTSYTHHPFYTRFAVEVQDNWRNPLSWNLPMDEMMRVIDNAVKEGYTIAWGGDVSGDFTRTGLAMLPDGIVPTQQMRQEQWDDWRFTYDHVMLIYGKAVDEQGKPYYMVKNSWGESGQYKGIWYMSRDYMTLNTVYLFLNRQALPDHLAALIAKTE
jgi:aminopeptidase C